MSELLIYREHFRGKLPDNLGFNFDSCDIFFKKKRSDEACLQVYKEDNSYRLTLSYFVGVDWVPNTNQAIYVEPKLNGSESQTDYLRMLFSALKHPEVSSYTEELFEIKSDETPIEISQNKDLLTPLLVVQFLKVVKEIVRKGLRKSYYKVESNLYAKVKGKVLVSQTIKTNLLKNKPLNTYCSYDEFGWNGLENRLLKKALVFVQRYLPTLKIPASKEYTTDIFNYINPAFEFVSEEVELNDVKHTKTNAFYKEYEEGLRLAKLILKRFGYNITNTQQETIKTPPFWIDMSKLFELYVLGLLKDKFGSDVHYHLYYKGNELDYLLNSENYKMIIDAKYKLVYQQDGKWDIENIRQLSGYARLKDVYAKLNKNETEVIDCLIIYPLANTLVESEKKFEIDFSKLQEMDAFVSFKTLGVSLPLLPLVS